MQVIRSSTGLLDTKTAINDLSPVSQKSQSESPGFKEVLSGLREMLDKSSGLNKSLVDFQNSVVEGRAVSAKEILAYQVRASQFGIQVELLSRAVESGLSLLRKLQQTQ